MIKYEKPVIEINSEIAEGVYAASGATVVKCDSVYMNGIWQPIDTSSWGTETRGYKQQFGCAGCPANTGSGCAIATGNHYDDSGNALSYLTDEGNRKPSWEKKGYGPDDVVTDWDV